MGTNYYMFIKNKKVARDNFAEVDEYGNVDPEYEIVDEPELGYKIHLNKCSYGWRPLFQIHKAFRSFSEMESFYNDMIEFMGTYIMLGFRIALPVFAVILIVNCMLGVMAKVSPQMNMFAVGIQIKAMVGMVVIFITVRVLPKAADMVFVQMKTNIATVVKAMMPG